MDARGNNQTGLMVAALSHQNAVARNVHDHLAQRRGDSRLGRFGRPSSIVLAQLAINEDAGFNRPVDAVTIRVKGSDIGKVLGRGMNGLVIISAIATAKRTGKAPWAQFQTGAKAIAITIHAIIQKTIAVVVHIVTKLGGTGMDHGVQVIAIAKPVGAMELLEIGRTK